MWQGEERLWPSVERSCCEVSPCPDKSAVSLRQEKHPLGLQRSFPSHLWPAAKKIYTSYAFTSEFTTATWKHAICLDTLCVSKHTWTSTCNIFLNRSANSGLRHNYWSHTRGMQQQIVGLYSRKTLTSDTLKFFQLDSYFRFTWLALLFQSRPR